jgi:hypothetical protein
MFKLGIILSYTEFRCLAVDLENTYYSEYAEELSFQDFLISDLEMLLDQYQAERFIVFLPENFSPETEKLIPFYVDAEGLAFLITNYLNP